MEENKVNHKTFLRNNWSICLVALYLLTILVYVMVVGEDVYIPIHDNLDSTVANYKLLKDNHLFWDNGGVAPFLSGIERHFMESQFHVNAILYMVLPIFGAVIAEYFLTVIVAVLGSIYLGKILVGGEWEKYKHIIILCGWMLGVLPVHPDHALGFAALPLMFGLLIKIYKTNSKWTYLWLILSTSLSSFTMFGIFICGYLLIFFLINWIVKKKPSFRMLIALGSLILGYVITEYHVFYIFLFSDVETIRNTMSVSAVSFTEAWKESLRVFLYGHYHSGSAHTCIVLPVCGIYFLFLNIRYIYKKQIKAVFRDPYNWLCIWCGCNALLYGYNQYPPLKKLIEMLLPVLKGFSIARALWLNPFVWYFMFAFVLYRLLKGNWNKKVIYGICIAAFLAIGLNSRTPTYNIYRTTAQNMYRAVKGLETELTYREFYSEKLFEEIKKDIGYQGEYAAAFGFHPAILYYNGIATLDGYHSWMPLAYNEQFTKLIEPDLAVDSKNAEYFYRWGGRAYLYSKDIDFGPARYIKEQEVDLLINPSVFKEMSGVYIFSRYKLSNADKLGLDFIQDYDGSDTPYHIYVYKSTF